MPTTENYIGIDRALALLVILEQIHNGGYEVITRSKLAKFVKNTSLVYWYPEGRDLPDLDTYKEINPWFDDIFNDDLPELMEKKFVVWSDFDKGIKLTKKGRFFGRELASLSQYSRFAEEVYRIIINNKDGLSSSSLKLWRTIRLDSKKPYKNESLVYDRQSADETFLIGIAVEPNKISSYFDPKPLLSAIKDRLIKKEVLRATHYETQLKFLYEICRHYENAPLKEKPLVEVCGLCREEKTHQTNKIAIIVEGQRILILAPNLTFSPEKMDYHGVRVVGIPNLARGGLEIEAVQIFDRGKFFPTNGRVL